MYEQLGEIPRPEVSLGLGTLTGAELIQPANWDKPLIPGAAFSCFFCLVGHIVFTVVLHILSYPYHHILSWSNH